MFVSIRGFKWGLLSLVALPLLAGCFFRSSNTCVNPKEPYLAARNNPQLHMPDGLTAPDRSVALTIPDLKANPDQQRSGEGCLDDPPSYFRSSGTVARSPEEVVASWAQAWAAREADAVLALYSSTFVAPTDSAGSTAWLDQRREQVATGPVPDPMISALKIESDGEDRRIATFLQKFGANSLRKELTLVREAGSWRIVSEKVVDVK